MAKEENVIKYPEILNHHKEFENDTLIITIARIQRIMFDCEQIANYMKEAEGFLTEEDQEQIEKQFELLEKKFDMLGVK